MTYASTSPLSGRGTTSAEAIQAWFVARGPAYAPDYAPDRKYKAPPPDLGHWIVEYGRRWNLNHDLAAGQIMDETAAWQSEYARERNNPGGLGAENDNPDEALWFATVAEGVAVHFAHLANYVHGRGEWTAVDTRGLPAAYYGIAKTPRDLEQRWAWSKQSVYDATPVDQRYGAQIAKLANLLVDFANNGTWIPPMARVPKPAMTIRHSPHFDGYDDGPRQYLAFCDHIATGTKESNLNWITSSNPDAPSVNYYIAKNGEITEVVPLDHAPWTNGWKNDGRDSRPDLSNPVVKYCYDNRISPNVVTVTIEHEGEPSDALTPQQIDANCRLKAWVSQETGIPLDRAHMLGHYQIDSVNRAYCPSFSDAEWTRLVDGARAILNGATPTPPPDDWPKVPSAVRDPWRDDLGGNPWGRDKWIPKVFVNDILAHGWYVTGFVVTEAFAEDDLIVQYFERARLELHRDGSVTRGLVGYEALVAKHPDRRA